MPAVIRTVFVFGYVGLSLVLLIPFMFFKKLRRDGTLFQKINAPRPPNPAFALSAMKIARFWARSIIKAIGARMHITGLEHVQADETVLFVSNHQSDFDILVFLAYAPMPVGFVAKIEMLKVPLLRTWIDLIGSVFINRSDIRQSAKMILLAIEKLRGGHSMVIFPEGTRSKSNYMLPFKPGSFKLATKPGVPVVPVTISGSYMVLEGNNYLIAPADVYVTFHPAVPTQGLAQDALNALPKQVEETIKGGLFHDIA
jgi:1-acyl-sn-glycerol-3-phosphate acyltransferase